MVVLIGILAHFYEELLCWGCNFKVRMLRLEKRVKDMVR